MSTLDKETLKVLSEQEAIAQVVNSEGWKYIRQIYFDKLLGLQNSFDIDMNKTPTTIAKEIAIRRKAHEVLTDFWQEVEGTASQADENKVLLQDKSYIYKASEE